ncbi:MAG: hypothetical protein QM793_03445 [Muricomes sp.]
MWTILFVVTTIICGIGWLIRYISCTAMIYYVRKNGYKLPTDEELKECTQFVIKHLFK